jgi:tRNA 5-methylaminomethyl-2-thiouridine biosynthesis bifunctional protein
VQKRVLITDWGDGSRFFHVWQQASASPAQAPQRITSHVVAFTERAPAWAQLHAALRSQWPDLHAHWWGLSEGFHRFDLGPLQLTLCVGEKLAQLKALSAVFDEVWQTGASDKWWFKALAHKSRLGTVVHLDGQAPREQLLQAGFVEQAHHDQPAKTWTYHPSWQPKQRGPASTRVDLEPSNVLVIGAGLAGACVAAALARRGHAVTVLDAAAHAAAGASGLPAGLMAPLLSRDDNPRSRLVRAGLRLSLQAITRLSEGYSVSGLLEKNAAAALPAQKNSEDWSEAQGADVWHPHAAWVSPAALVRQCLATPGVQFVGNSAVARLAHQHGQWQALDQEGQVLGQAARVVLANALGSLTLAQALTVGLASGMRGLVVMGDTPKNTQSWPTRPINGHGGLIPQLPTATGTVWAFGATYEASGTQPFNVAQHTLANQAKLAALLPELAHLIPEAQANGTLKHWQGERCVTADRFPLLGPLDEAQTLWLCTGMGSRGLSFAALCAEQLAALWHQEPAPLRTDLAKFVSLDRFFKTK